MKSKFWLLGGLLWLASASAWAQDAARDNSSTNAPRRLPGVAKSVVLDTPAPATVSRLESLNVRSEPNFTSDILTHARRGQTVTVFEQLSLSKPKPNEPTNWARIALPTNASVWVAAQYIDTNTMTVSARRVNVRGGPSDNYTVVCRLEKGAPVQEVAHRPDWIQIVPPTNAFGYVAAEYLTMEPVTVPPAAVVSAEPAVAAATPAPAPATPPAAAVPTTPTPEPAAIAPATNTTAATPDASTNAAAPTNTVATADAATPIVAPDPTAATPPPPATPAPAAPIVTPAAATAPETAPVKPAPVATATPANPAPADNTTAEVTTRVTTREGIIRRAINIQAPADFELRDVNSGEVLEYVQPDPKDKNFKKYVGARVLVTGPEWLDRRWPKRPILKVETIDLLP